VEPAERARFAVRLIVTLAVVGIAAPALVSASVTPAAGPPVSLVGAPPSAKPTHRPKATLPPPIVTPAPTTAPTAAPTLAPPPKATTPPPPAPAAATEQPAPAQPAPAAQPNGPSAVPAATPPPAIVAPPEPSASAPAGAGVVGLGNGGRPGSEETDGFGVLGPAVGAAALVALAFWFVVARRRRSREDAADGAFGPLSAVPVSIDSLAPVPPRQRAVDDDEANMPRWLRPSVRAERFSGYQSSARATIGGSTPETPIEAAPMGAVIDLDALFASRRSPEAGAKPPARPRARRSAERRPDDLTV